MRASYSYRAPSPLRLRRDSEEVSSFAIYLEQCIRSISDAELPGAAWFHAPVYNSSVDFVTTEQFAKKFLAN